MSWAFNVTVSVTPVPARRRASWAKDGRTLVLEPLEPLDYKEKPLQPLEAFRRLWRALEGGAGDGFKRFRDKICEVIPRAGCLAPYQPLSEEPIQAGLLEFAPFRVEDSLLGWLEAVVHLHLWVEALNASDSNAEIVPFVENWLRTVHQHIGLERPDWHKYYPFLFSLEDEPRWEGSPEWHQDMQAVLRRWEVECLSLPFDTPLKAAAKLVAWHKGRRQLSSKQIRKGLYNEGLRGLQIPAVYPSLVYGPVGVEMGLYHLALLRLSSPRALRACAVCGGFFQPQRSTARYCSGRCRTAAHRAGGR